MKLTESLFLTFLFLLVISCDPTKRGVKEQGSPLASYFETYHFTPFTTPNNVITPATIIYFNKGQEEVIAFPSDCDSLATFSAAADIVRSPTATLDSEFDITNVKDASLILSPELISRVNLNVALQDTSIKKVRIKLINPFVSILSRAKAFQIISGSKKYCQKQVQEKQNVIVHQVIGADGLEFSFIGSRNRVINLTSSLSNQISTDNALRTKLESEGTITLDQPMFFGYRAFKGNVSSGLFTDPSTIVEVSEDEIDRMKKSTL